MKTLFGAMSMCAALFLPVLAGPSGAQAPAPPATPASPGVPARPVPPRAAPLTGRTSMLGIMVRDASADDISKAKLSQPGGVVVQNVTPGSAGERAGLTPGDIIVEFDGERVRSARQFTRLVQDTPAGRTVKATIARDGSRRALDVTPDEPRRASADSFYLEGLDIPRISDDVQRKLEDLQQRLPELERDVERARGRRLGTALLPLSDQLAGHFGVKRGVLVASVEVDSAAARAGLMAGDVITAINGHEVSSPADVRAELRAAGAGSKIDLRVMRDRKELTLSATN